jgi:DNA-binding CsgD family transcriptional regulator
MPLTVKSLEKTFGLSSDHVAERLAILTPRETEVVHLLADGLQPRKIAAGLGISPKTLDIHRANIKTKLDVKTTVDLAKFVFLKRLVELTSKELRRQARAN